ncbi:MAG: hypothetical protein HC852_01700 [Acaryochloridaceae cyanobacterium RU_4_10]|nr:hypothetical protein [Acaryochloridaceae cyanobacterium RU_4_10]
MTLIKLPLKTPLSWNAIRIVQLGNGKSTKDLVDYRFEPDFEQLGGIRSLHERGIRLRSLSTIAEVLRIVGPYATLWIGPHKGTIAPMDVQPIGWVYGNGDEYEPENFWQWVPDGLSEAQLVTESNRFSTNQLEMFFEKNKSVFKPLVPAQFDREYGQILEIEAIPIQRLADLISKDVDWVFEFEQVKP